MLLFQLSEREEQIMTFGMGILVGVTASVLVDLVVLALIRHHPLVRRLFSDALARLPSR